MNKNLKCLFVVLVMMGIMPGLAVSGDWRFPVGLSYVSGFSDILDLHEDNLKAEGYVVDTVEGIPVGISFHPYYQFDFGLCIGSGIGPVMIILGDSEFFDLPLNLDVRYMILPNAGISPYIRAGMRFHITGGDYVSDSEVGFFGGAGVEFARKSTVGFGIEVAFDTTELEFENYSQGGYEKIQPDKVLVSFFAVF